MNNLLNQLLGYVKEYFQGVWYMLTGQWKKAWDLTATKVDHKNDKDA